VPNLDFSEKLDSFGDLQQGWDSCDAPPPNACAIDNARRILNFLALAGAAFLVRRIAPSVEGGIGVVFACQGQRYPDIECFNDGTIMAIASDGADEPVLLSLTVPKDEVADAPR